MTFERVGGKLIHEGQIGTLRVEEFKHDDGEVVKREVLEHPGAAVMLPLDGDRIWLVRQPREVAGEQSLLELPAGKLNGGEPLDTAKRELREEIGKSAATWQHLTSFYTSPGFTDELMHVFRASRLREVPRRLEPGETIDVEIVAADAFAGLMQSGELVDGKSIAAWALWNLLRSTRA